MNVRRVIHLLLTAFLSVLILYLTLLACAIPAYARETQVWDTSQTGTGSITIQKYAEDDFLVSDENLSQEEIAAYLQEHPDELTPLSGVIFHVRKIADAAQYVSGNVVSIGYNLDQDAAEFLGLHGQESAAELDGVAYYDIADLNAALEKKSVAETEEFMANALAMAPTDASGQSTVSGLDVGCLYLFCEYSYPSTAVADTDHCAPFFVAIPSTDHAADGSVYWDYDITVVPKNMIQPIRNDLVIVDKEGNETHELDAETNTPVQFLARSEVPSAVGKTSTYTVEINPGAGITVLPETILIYGVAGDGTRTLLTEENGDLSIALPAYHFDPSALADEEGLAKYDSVEIYYKAMLNEEAIIGGEGNPTAMQTTYSHSTNGGEDVEVLTPHVHEVRLFTYEIHARKIGEDTKQGLPGVTFQLQEENGSAIPVRRLSDGVFILDNSGEDTLTTAADGTLRILGVEAANYYLKELANGNPLYNLLSNRIEIQILSNEIQYERSNSGTFAPLENGTRYFTDALPERNYFLPPLSSGGSSRILVQEGTFVCFGTDTVRAESDGAEVERYEVAPLAWSSNYAMGSRDGSADSGVVSLEIVNSRVPLAPKTGDTGMIALAGLCLLAACAGLGVLAATKGKLRRSVEK